MLKVILHPERPAWLLPALLHLADSGQLSRPIGGCAMLRDAVVARVSKRVHGVENLYLAGQWVEPGGGVPPALLSGRQAVQRLAHDERAPFAPAVAG